MSDTKNPGSLAAARASESFCLAAEDHRPRGREMSAGVFAVNQPIYAERGIATFPLRDNKVPAIGNYQTIGLPASSKLALNARFRSANGFGFMTNARTRISVLDIDTTDERVLADALGRHGSTPLVARTASGKFHAFYRHNGEHRKIRPFNDLPIDLLGNRGYVVATPSRLEKGAYSFVQGSLDDLGRLPVMRGLDSDMYSRAAQIPARPVQSTCQEAGPVCEGVRNDSLWRFCMQQLSLKGHDIDALVVAAIIRNTTFKPPLPESEAVKIVASAWGRAAQGRNWFGNGTVALRHDEVDELPQDAAWLLTKLRRHNWGRDFILANAMAETLGWTIKRFAAAKAELERMGKIRCVRDRNGGNRPPTYTWG
jgi:hypothetical protein